MSMCVWSSSPQEKVSRGHDQMQRALLLAVKWNQPEFCKQMLIELPDDKDYSRPLRKMLQQALELQRVEIVKLLLERPGCSLDGINLCQLYLQEDTYNFLRSDQTLQARLARGLADGSIANRHSYKLFKELVGPFLRQVSQLIHAAVSASSQVSHFDVFVWAVLIGNVPLARELWTHVENPLHCALIAADVFKTMGRSDKVYWGRQEIQSSAAELEAWAIGVMDLVDEQEIAHVILSQFVPAWRMGALVELALHMEHKAFLAHRHCQSLMDLWWRGGYPGSSCLLKADESLTKLCVWIWLPFLNPYLYASTQKAPGRDWTWRSSREIEEVLYGALAQALSLSGRERRNARASPALPIANMARARTRKLPALTDVAKPSGRIEANRLRRQESGGHDDLSDLLPASTDGRSGSHLLEQHPMADDELSTKAIKRTRTLQNIHGKTPHAIKALVHKVEAEKARVAISKSAGFYSVPLVKFLLRAMWHVAFLCMYGFVLTHLLTIDQLAAIAPNLPPLATSEKIFIVWAGALGAEHHLRSRKMQHFGLTAKLPFQSIIYVAHAILAIALGLRLLSALPVGSDGKESELVSAIKHVCYAAYQTIISVDSVLISLELFTFMWISLNFGVLAIIMVRMLVDLSLFFVFFAVILLGFSAALLGLSETTSHEHLDSTQQGRRALEALYTTAPAALAPLEAPLEAADWSTAGFGADGGGATGGTPASSSLLVAAGRHVLRALRGSTYAATDPEDELPLLALPLWAMFTDLEPHRFVSVPFGLPLMYAYVMIANVVLVNLLIAMFSETYVTSKKHADVEYHYQRFLPIFEHHHVVHAVPPPFNIPWLLKDLLEELLERCGTTGVSSGSGGDGGDGNGAPRGVDALHKLAAARPEASRHSSTTSKKFVQEFLKVKTDKDGELATLKKVEGIIQSLDERVGQQLELMVGGRGMGYDNDLRSLVVSLAHRLDKIPGMPKENGGAKRFSSVF